MPRSRRQGTTSPRFSTPRSAPVDDTHPGIDHHIGRPDRLTEPPSPASSPAVQKGLLVRNPSSRDRRARDLQITEAGKRTLRGITPAVEAAQRTMLRGLTEKEGADLMRLLRKAIAAGNELSRAPLRDAELR